MSQAPFVAFKVPLSEVSDTCTITFFLVLCVIRHERWVSIVFFFVSKFELLMNSLSCWRFYEKRVPKEKKKKSFHSFDLIWNLWYFFDRPYDTFLLFVVVLQARAPGNCQVIVHFWEVGCYFSMYWKIHAFWSTFQNLSLSSPFDMNWLAHLLS